MSPTRKVLITGAGTGIGRALAIEAAQKGFDLILVGRTSATLEETRSKCEEIGFAAFHPKPLLPVQLDQLLRLHTGENEQGWGSGERGNWR